MGRKKLSKDEYRHLRAIRVRGDILAVIEDIYGSLAVFVELYGLLHLDEDNV
jgi:hypothetical protein